MRRSLRLFGFIALVVGVTAASHSEASAAVNAVFLPAGWAAGGDPAHPNTQVDADTAGMAAGKCGANSLLLFRVRGSGEKYKTDRLGSWAGRAGARAIELGWNVRDMQAIYFAADLPIQSWERVVTAPGAVMDDFARYRNDAVKSAAAVRKQLTNAHDRCPQRRILVAGYSQGNIVLRWMFAALPLTVRNQIVSTDLVADPHRRSQRRWSPPDRA